ncbi:MAG: hypothetical protein PHI85_00510 [Victivallaceae bacterium]|nr:hypothetical protein [Victivallaceae bacterium]
MSKALELFGIRPRQYNCAQAVACGCGTMEMKDDFAAYGGGRAPGGRCGALFAALSLVPESGRPALAAEFAAELGAETCGELKGVLHVPCERCVELGAKLVEKYGKK